MSDYIKMYASVSDLIASDKSVVPDPCSTVTTRVMYSFHGVNDIATLEEIIHKGWPEGEKMARQSLSAISIPKTKTVRRRKTRGDFGDHLDIQRVYAGSLDTAWERTERTYAEGQQGRHITLLVNISTSANKSVSEMFWRGAATLALADELEKAGRRCEIIAYSYVGRTYRDDSGSLVGVRLKDFDQPLEPKKLIAFAGHAGFFRWYVMRNLLLHKGARIRPGMGHPVWDIPKHSDLGLPASRNVIPINRVFSKYEADALLKNVLPVDMKH